MTAHLSLTRQEQRRADLADRLAAHTAAVDAGDEVTTRTTLARAKVLAAGIVAVATIGESDHTRAYADRHGDVYRGELRRLNALHRPALLDRLHNLPSPSAALPAEEGATPASPGVTASSADRVDGPRSLAGSSATYLAPDGASGGGQR